MRVIITGGTGLIGQALMKSLVPAGHEVIILTRNPRRVSGLPAGVQAERWDARTAAGWVEHVEDAVIVNLAGENIASGPWTAERKRTIRESRLNAGAAVTQAVAMAPLKPRVVIQASAVGYYGPRGDEEVTEDTLPGSDFLAQVCVDWEASTAAVEAQGVRRVIVRSAVVLSLNEGAFPRLLTPFRLFVGGPLGNGRQWFPWIHVADEAAAIRFLIEKEQARGPFNLVAPQALTNKQFARVIGRVMHRPSIVPTPALALRLVLGELSMALLKGQRVVPKRLADLGFVFRFPEAEAALRDLFR